MSGQITLANNLLVATDSVEAAQTQIAATEPGTTEAALLAAVEQSGTQDDDLSPEALAWIKERLGVGEASGLIDDLVAQETTGN